MSTIQPDELRSWIDRSLLSDIEDVSDQTSSTYHAILPTHGEPSVTAVMENEQSGVRLTCRDTVSEEVAKPLMNDYNARQRLRMFLTTVFLNTPGSAVYIDGDGSPCQFGDMRGGSFVYILYPDKASQHTFMTSVMELAEGMNMLVNGITGMRGELEMRR